MHFLKFFKVNFTSSKPAFDVLGNHYGVRRLSLTTRNEAMQRTKQKVKFNPKTDPNSQYTTVAEANFKECKKDPYIHRETCLLDPCKPQPKVVIIGAGVAGLACSNVLHQCGLKDFVVLEASEKPGGRVETCWVENAIVCEMGPQWMQGGGPANPLFGIAVRAGLIQEPLNVLQPRDSRSLICMKSDGKPVDLMATIIGTQLFEQIKDQAKELFLLSSGKGYGTLFHFLDKRVKEELKVFPDHRKKDLRAVMYGYLNGIRARWGADTREMSAVEYGAYEGVPGPSLLIPAGMVGALVPLVEKIPKDNFCYNMVVKSISWGEGKAEVATQHGERFPADVVVITLPLGVLKAEQETMFIPRLPEAKLKAIQGLGYGKTCKLFLQYDSPFWSSGNAFDFAWTDEELLTGDCWLNSVSRMQELPGRDNFLMTTVSGNAATQVECMDECQIAQDVTKLLRQFTGMKNIPYPNNVLKTEWCTNQHFLGTNCFMGLESKASMICDLAQPVSLGDNQPPILLFAGEATADTYFSTMQGAYFSGVREAGRVLEFARQVQLA